MFLITVTGYTVVLAQGAVVSGTGIDTRKQESLAGINFMVEGATVGISTNIDGGHSFEVPSLQDAFVYSFVGYQQQEESMNGRIGINISLKLRIISGEEMVIGYEEQKKVTATGTTC